MTDFIADIIVNNGAEFYSEAIDALAYNREDKQLLVEFASGGDYVYGGVEESTFNLLVEAPSVGRFYRNHIQGKYTNLNLNITDIIEREPVKDNVVAFPTADDVRADNGFDVQPQKKWLTQNDEGPFRFDDGTVLAIQPSTFGVKWTNGTLTFEPTFQALSEADALAQFNAALAATGINEAKIVSVTHYFE